MAAKYNWIVVKYFSYFLTAKKNHFHILSKQIQHTVQIDFFSDMYLVFRSGHVIEQKFQYQSTSESSSFYFEIWKSHWQIAVLDILYPDKSWILHCFWKAVSLFRIRRSTVMFRVVLSQILPAHCLIAAFSILTAKPAAFIT